MDYSKIFEENYQETFHHLEKFVNNEFQSSKEKDEDEREFSETCNEINSQLAEWKNQHFEQYSLKTKIETYKYFKSRNKVTFPEFLLPGVLERKTKTLFLENYSEKDYTAFIQVLAENKAYEDITDITHNYDKYFDLVYRDKKWKLIDLTKYDINFESADYFLKLHKKIFPPANQANIARKKDYSQEIRHTKNILNKFSEEEKIFLVKLFFEQFIAIRSALDKTEFIKFSQVISGIEDLSIFYKRPQNSSFYDLTNKDYEYFSRLDKGNFFKILINKLDAAGLKSIKAQVRILQSRT